MRPSLLALVGTKRTASAVAPLTIGLSAFQLAEKAPGARAKKARAELAGVPLGLQQRDERGELPQLQCVSRAVLVEIKEHDEAVLRHPFQKYVARRTYSGVPYSRPPLRRLYPQHAAVVLQAERLRQQPAALAGISDALTSKFGVAAGLTTGVDASRARHGQNRGVASPRARAASR